MPAFGGLLRDRIGSTLYWEIKSRWQEFEIKTKNNFEDWAESEIKDSWNMQMETWMLRETMQVESCENGLAKSKQNRKMIKWCNATKNAWGKQQWEFKIIILRSHKQNDLQKFYCWPACSQECLKGTAFDFKGNLRFPQTFEKHQINLDCQETPKRHS